MLVGQFFGDRYMDFFGLVLFHVPGFRHLIGFIHSIPCVWGLARYLLCLVGMRFAHLAVFA